MPPDSLTLVERYGSLGMIFVMLLAGVTGMSAFAWWFTQRGIPQAIEFMHRVLAEHKAERERKDAEHRAERQADGVATREALGKITGAIDKQGEQLDGHGDRLDRIEDRLDNTRGPRRQ